MKCTEGHAMVGVDMPKFAEIVWYCPIEGCTATEEVDEICKPQETGCGGMCSGCE